MQDIYDKIHNPMGNRITEPYGFIEETEYDSLRNQFEDACNSGSIESGDGSITVDTSGSDATKIKVNVDPAEGNIITVGANGLYVSAALSYDGLTNTLTFTTSDGKTADIHLLSNSLIDSVSYNPVDETIVIEYTINGVAMDAVVVPVSSLIEEWEVDNNTEGAIKLTKTRNVDGKDILSASVVINSVAADNALVNQNGSLYVSKDEILAGTATKADIETLQSELAKKVEYTDIATAENPNRKAIVLANHDTILGTTTAGATQNLVMMSKWDKADFGSAAVVLNLNGSAERPTYNDEKEIALIDDIAPIKESLENKVEYSDIVDAQNPNRKAIILANHDTILGTSTSGGTVNIAMVSKWDKVDLGSASMQMNLNTANRVQVNDSEEVAYVSDVEQAVENANAQLEGINLVQKEELVYELQVGDRIAGTINLPKDQFLKNVEYNPETKVLTFTFETTDGEAVTPIDMSGLVDVYTAGDGISLRSNAFSLNLDPTTQQYIEVSSEGLKIVGVDEALAKKVEWTDISTTENPNRASIVLNNHDTILGKKTDGNTVNVAMVSKWDKVDLGSAQAEINLNGSAERPTYNDEKEIALIDDIDALVESVEVNIPIRSLSDKIYDKATILGWFGVEDEATLKGLITREGQFYLKYGITLSYNPHFYRMPIQYVAFESAEQIKLVFVGLDTSNDVASKYEIVMNLDETVIEGNSNVKMTITPIDEKTDLSAYATVEALSNEANVREAKDTELEKSFNEQIAKKGMYYPSVKVDTQKLFALTKASSEDDIKAALQIETASGSYTLPTAAIFDDCLGKGYQLLSNWMPVSVAWNGAAYVLYVVGQSYMMQPTGLYTVAIRITAEGQYSVFQAAKFEEFATVDEIPSVSGFITSEEANATYQPKGEYVALTDSKDIILPLNGSVTMIQDTESGTGGVVICQRNYGSGNVTEVSNVRNLLTLNAKERPQVDLEGGVQEKIAYLSEINKIMDSITVLNDKVNLLQNKVDASFIAEAENVENYDGSAELNDETKSYVIDNATISNDAALTANAVTLSNAALDADTKLAITANSADINGLKVNGGVAKTKANATITANNADFITFKDMTFNASNNVYNGVEIGLSEGSLPKNVLFENCRFEGEFSNNAILVFGTQDNATITLNNCYFESVSNALRLSNRANASGVTVNIINCTVDKWDERAQYGGFLILEDYTSKNVEEVSTNNLFGNGKITVNFSNLIYNGNVMIPSDVADVCGTQDSNQIIYVYADQKGTVDEYNVDIYPIVTFR